jgi:hypothetical protein
MKNWQSKKINKIDKLLARLRKNTKINKIRDKNGDIRAGHGGTCLHSQNLGG